jgi:hypothetical protein
MQVNDYHLEKYQINKLSMTKSFLSSSIDERIATWFLCRQESSQTQTTISVRTKADGSLTKLWVMCKYHIRQRRTALYIENSSQYTAEAEVLIMPYAVFKVKSKKTVVAPYLSDKQTIIEIEFEEYD